MSYSERLIAMIMKPLKQGLALDRRFGVVR